MKMDKEMKYEAPEVLVLSVTVEKGFEASITGPEFSDDGTGGVDLP